MEQQTANKSYSLTKAQKRVWFHSKMSEKPLPNIVMVFELEGELDVWALRKTIEQLVEENSVLKSTIYSSKDSLERIINPAVRGNLEVVDLTTSEKNTDIFWLLQNIAGMSFNLGNGPLFHFHLIKESAEHYYFTIAIHPIIVDRYSLKFLVEEISRHYNLITNNTDSAAKEELFDFNNIVDLEKKFYASNKYKQGLTHWTNTLKANHFHVDLPKKGYFNSQSYEDSPFIEVFLSESLRESVRQFAHNHQTDFGTVLMAAYLALLQRYTGNNDVIVNYSSSVSYTDKKIFGCLENRLPLRVLMQDEMSFSDLLHLTKMQLSYDHYYKDIQITDIVKSVRDKYDSRFSGIFSNTSFDINYLPYEQMRLGNVKSKLIPKFMKKFVTESIALYYKDTGKSISLIADIDESIDSIAVRNFMQHYEELLQKCLQDPREKIVKHGILSGEEYKKVVAAWNDTTEPYPDDLVHKQFEKSVKESPEAVAIHFEGQELTYNELNTRANQLAHMIRRHIENISASTPEGDKLVGICITRSLDMIVSMLAALKAGVGYVPLDPTYPEERLIYILEDTKIKLILSETRILDGVNYLKNDDRTVIALDAVRKELSQESEHNLDVSISPNNLAYIIYTSGSTGLPKGVMIEHKSCPNLVYGFAKNFLLKPGKRVLQFSSMNFDIIIPEVFSTLAHGATAYVVSEDMRQAPDKLAEYLEKNAINLMLIPPAVLRMLPHRELPAMETIAFGGDVCDQETIDFWSKGRRFFNAYGPTEITVCSGCGLLQPGDPANRLGRPLPNYRKYILDAYLNPVPVGMVGELYIAGIGLSRGYINKEKATAERFVPDIFSQVLGERLYRTGDLVRYLSSGDIEYIGRADFEVKIRGFRIHMGDIEHVLLLHPAIKQVATRVWQQPGFDKVIAAYYVLNKREAVDTKSLREHIANHLPEYMVPGFLIELDEMPLSVSGKLNKNMLPDPFPKSGVGAIESEQEQIIKDIWAELFKLTPDTITGQTDFFDLGGHSLLATQLVSRIKSRLNVDLTVKAIFQNSQLKQLAKIVKESQALLVAPFLLENAPEQELYTPSYSQMRLWYFSKVGNARQTYNLLFGINFSNNVDIIALRKALIKLFAANENFKTSFLEKQGEVHLRIHDAIHCDIPLVDCTTAEDIQLEINREKEHIFALDQAPLFRAKLLLSETQGVTLLFNVHHIIFDGWSLDIFMRQLGQYYSAITQNKAFIPVTSAINFKDFAHSQMNWEKSGLFNDQLTYWQRKLSKPLPILELPTDYKRPSVMQFEGDSVRFQLPDNLVAAAKKLAAANKTSLYSLLLSVYYVLLNRITHQTDLIVASPIANRTQQDVEHLMGMFANVVAYRTHCKEDMSFDDLLKAVNEDVITTHDNQDVPFDIIVNQIQSSRDTSRNPIFQTMFILHSGFKLQNQWSDSNITYQIREENTKTSKFDMTFVLYDNSAENQISGFIEFNTHLYKRETIARYAQYFNNILRSITENTQRAIENIVVLPAEEYKTTVHQWNQNPMPYKSQAIHKAFEEQVAATPSNTAVVFQDEKVTYHELNVRANQLAAYIQKHYRQTMQQDLTPGTFIGISLDRGIDMIVAMLATLKTGAAYLPLDPTYPRDRLAYMLNDTGAKMIISKQNLQEKADFLNSSHYQVIYLDRLKEEIARENPLNLDNYVKPNDIAYVIYTSGSTGLPKGVMVEHKGIPSLAYHCRDLFKHASDSRNLFFSSINFDAAVYEVFQSLLAGSALYIVSEDYRASPEKLVDYLQENQISFATMPPALLRVLPRRELPALRSLVFAGDTCDQESMDYWIKGRDFYNAYGPTETTVCATIAKLRPEGIVNCIGTPVANTKIYVLDANLSPVPVGVYGELYIGGIGLARGYLNRPDLTVERFIVNPFSDDPAEKIYKTGDVVRWREDGELEYLGRSDFQVQIRGFRVELGEIEEVLGQHHLIKQVAVAALGESINKQLIAYYTQNPTVETVTADEFRRYLQSKLPEYMVPSAFIKIEKMPLSPSGKIDKKQLPKLDDTTVLSQNQYVPPSNAIESQLVTIWTELFKHPKIGVTDNFFQLGGNSLLSIRLLAKVKEAFGKEVSLSNFFQQPTIAGLAMLISGHTHALDVIAAAIADAEQPVITHTVTYPEKMAIHNVLLTGANGFLGVYLLDSLLRNTQANIYCLIRAKDLAQGREKLNSVLKKFSLLAAIDNPRIHIILGDLSREKLGINPELWTLLEEEIDAVYHNGALVNHIYDYQILKSTNVGSTIELIKLCASKKAKYFHYISTFSAASQFDDAGTALEVGPGNKPPFDMGYLLSKWVSERIAYHAAEHGLHVAVYRPGNITGHSQTGITNFESNHALLFIKSCIQLGVAPLWKATIEMLPVDTLSEAIIKLSLHTPQQAKQTYNLCNPNHISYEEYFKIISEFGYKLRVISTNEWRDNYLKSIDESNALYTLRDLYMQHDADPQPFHFDCNASHALLTKLGVKYLDNYAEQINIYMEYLKNSNFITENNSWNANLSV